ncbi:sodium-dependent phosphate transport protein 2B-like isoform X2 [Lineus longissimus]|uniref:sodium-dependent phosphate transport protein 2B-like isoform X2 n=1 Tax=Lineus longissimus TaxID=88925 RepID=UPI002B4C9F0A
MDNPCDNIDSEIGDAKTPVGVDNVAVDISDEKDHKANGKIPLEEGLDPWSTHDIALKDPGKSWAELDTKGKVVRVLWHYIGKILLLVGFLYLFICSLDVLSSAFKLLGGRVAGRAFADNELLQNPVAGLMVGVLATVLVQSSSTSTSIVVTMVAANILYVKTAIPIVMGANIGTSVTNTIVSMGHLVDQNEFRRAFGGATVHDMFNWLTVLILLPIEVLTGYLYRLSKAIVNSMELETYTSGKQELLKAVTKPFTRLIVKVDSQGIAKIASGDEEASESSLIKIWCKYNTTYRMENQTVTNLTEVNGLNMTLNFTEEVMVEHKIGSEKCPFMFMNVAGVWSDEAIGAILLFIALFILCACLVLIVKLLNSLLRGSIAKALKKFVNSDFPGKLGFLTGYIAIILGAGLTILVQSSSIFTSTLTPLVGIGVLSIDRMYPLTLGSNIGTTATGMLASLASSGKTLPNAMQVAFCHLFFNITGILIWYPVPFMRQIPIKMAMFLGNETAKYRWFAVVYLIMMFFCLPALVFGLSLAGWYILLAVCAPFALLAIVILIIKLIQNKRPTCLPVKMRTWKWLPEPLRSLAPLDRVFRRMCACCKSCKQEENGVELSVDENEKGGLENSAYSFETHM